ncbi:MAG: hypothetical protein RL383_1469 [Actinomycetota bacterium]
MGIGKNEDWGVPAAPAERAVAHDDRSVVLLQGALAPRVAGGNLHRALGAPGAPSDGSPGTELSLDALAVTVAVDGGTLVVTAAADVVVGSWWSRHGLAVVTNVGMWDALDIAPGGHPNDGRFEIVTVHGSMRRRDRLEARRRARTGSHIPHPSITRQSATSFSLERRGRQGLWIDSVRVPSWSSVRVELVPDALRVVV